jgi:hypothetical protein
MHPNEEDETKAFFEVIAEQNKRICKLQGCIALLILDLNEIVTYHDLPERAQNYLCDQMDKARKILNGE